MEKRSNSYLWKWFIFIGILFLLNFVRLPYYYTIPGEAKILSEVIEVEENFSYEGNFMLTTIRMGRANSIQYIVAYFSDSREIFKEAQIRPPGESDADFHHRQLMNMTTSQDQAKLVAYQEAGKEVRFENEGVYISLIIEGMGADGVLRAGDILTHVNDIEIETAERLLDELPTYQIGEKITVSFVRNDEAFTEEIEIMAFPDQEPTEIESGGIGIAGPVTLRTLITEPAVSIDTAQIGGPSAGLMFSLEIYNQLVPEDITKGYNIAGTGTISENGEIGRIGGIHQKVIAADQDDADYFLAPAENGIEQSNYEQALEQLEQMNSDMVIIPVNTFQETLSFLEQLEEK